MTNFLPISRIFLFPGLRRGRKPLQIAERSAPLEQVFIGRIPELAGGKWRGLDFLEKISETDDRGRSDPVKMPFSVVVGATRRRRRRRGGVRLGTEGVAQRQGVGETSPKMPILAIWADAGCATDREVVGLIYI